MKICHFQLKIDNNFRYAHEAHKKFEILHFQFCVPVSVFPIVTCEAPYFETNPREVHKYDLDVYVMISKSTLTVVSTEISCFSKKVPNGTPTN